MSDTNQGETQISLQQALAEVRYITGSKTGLTGEVPDYLRKAVVAHGDHPEIRNFGAEHGLIVTDTTAAS